MLAVLTFFFRHIRLVAALIGAIITFATISAAPKMDMGGAVSHVEGFTYPASFRFVANPVIATFFTFAFIYLISDSLLGFYEGVTDAICYCYTVDVHGGEDLQSCQAFGPIEEHPCSIMRAPQGLKNLLTSVVQEGSSTCSTLRQQYSLKLHY